MLRGAFDFPFGDSHVHRDIDRLTLLFERPHIGCIFVGPLRRGFRLRSHQDIRTTQDLRPLIDRVFEAKISSHIANEDGFLSGLHGRKELVAKADAVGAVPV